MMAGVWVLDTSEGYNRFEPAIGALKNVLTMKERCDVIEKLGGKFCSDMHACPEMAKLVD